MVDFSKIKRSDENRGRGPIHPIEIFERLPSLDNSPNDLWRGQAEALETWHKFRTDLDVLIALNTGAGKTIIGLLIGQSLINEGIENVIYCCATIDLVRQTADEARKIGLPCTTRTEKAYSDDQFESGKTFCVTTYQALFNGHSSLRRKHFPGAVIFDDAHVAESMLRDAVTLRIDSRKQPEAFGNLAALFEDHFKEIGKRAQYRDAVGTQNPTVLMASPGAVNARSAEIANLIERATTPKNDPEGNAYVLPYLSDRIDRCAVVFGNGICEITPPFLPSRALDVFDARLRRIYLSATLQCRTDFVRAFGRVPERIVEPKNDAGNGERLILNGDRITGGASKLLPKSLVSAHKVVIAVPSYPAAERWSDIAVPPPTREFSASLSAFRESKKPGAFLLVARVDGIDLPHDTCRIMILDGLPAGASLFERYLWEYVDLKNLSATKIANRIAQLFGRINRGRNDYGAFLTYGYDLNVWLANDRNVALLPDLLQQQISLGRDVQDNLDENSPREVRSLIEQVLSRDAGWIEFYGSNIEKGRLDEQEVAKALELDKGMMEAAAVCAEYARCAWEGEFDQARKTLEDSIEAIGRTDSRLAGWVNIWLAGCYEHEGDVDSAQAAYQRARKQLGVNFIPPRLIPRERGVEPVPLSPLGSEIEQIASTTSADAFQREMKRLRRSLSDLDGAKPHPMEESVRALGELLGFAASRPDNDQGGGGPDVLWESRESKHCLGLELKTDKQAPANYRKKDDIGQGHDSLEWIATNRTDQECLGLIFVGPEGRCTDDANPSKEMWLTPPSALMELRDDVFAIIDDIRRAVPLERRNLIVEKCNRPEWSLPDIFKRIRGRQLE
jgi:hypothetical protein